MLDQGIGVTSGLTRIVLLGAGGHASDVLGAIEAISDGLPAFDVVGLLADQPPVPGRFDGRGVNVIGTLDSLGRLGAVQAVAAIGYPERRAAVVAKAGSFSPAPPIVHPAATIAATATLSPGVVVLAGARVSPGAQIGPHALVSYNSFVGHECYIGPFVSVMPQAAVCGGCRVGEGSLIGVGAVVLERIEIGPSARVGAGAVVTRNVDQGVTVMGRPARAVGR